MKILTPIATLLALSLTAPAFADGTYHHPHHKNHATPQSQVQTNVTKTPDAQFNISQQKHHHSQAQHKRHGKAHGFHHKNQQKHPNKHQGKAHPNHPKHAHHR